MAGKEIVIEAGRSESRYWRDLWRYRELFGFLAWRDVLVRYRQTVFGMAWAVLRPLLIMLILVMFRRVTSLPPQEVPDSVFILAALLPWQLFSSVLSESSQSLVGNPALITKVYFPRMILPASAVVVALVDFGITLFLLAIIMAWHQVALTWRLMALPLFTLLALMGALGPGLWGTALNVKYRDFRFVIPFVVQFGLLASPIAVGTAEVARFGESARLLYSLNPMVGVIDGFRWSICGTPELHPASFAVSTCLSLLLLITGIFYFRRVEKTFADHI